MKYLTNYLLTFVVILFMSCNSDGDEGTAELSSLDSSGETNNNGNNGQAGLITAGEWNDLQNWDFWTNLMLTNEFSDFQDQWKFYNSHRIAVVLTHANQPYSNASLQLLKGEEVVWEAKTDNHGKAELWINLFEKNTQVDIDLYRLKINNLLYNNNLTLYKEGINHIETAMEPVINQQLQLCFVVDATGSMADEIEFLKDDLTDVIQRVQNQNNLWEIETSSVFYRDVDDEYLTRKSDFTNNLSTTTSFIQQQNADGGGDYPEAVHTALQVALDELQWSHQAKTRIAFLLLDAPPHHRPDVIQDIQFTVEKAAKMGVKIIPITASGIGKDTEFLMRFMAMTTNATYTFITNDSGIGNDHLEASVGDYEVEFLNDLIVRLITENAE